MIVSFKSQRKAKLRELFIQIRLLVITALMLVATTMQPAMAQSLVDSSSDLLSVPAGQTLLMRHAQVKRVAAGDGQIVDVKVFEDTGEVLLLGKSVGITDLRIWNRDGTSSTYTVKVVSPNPPAPAPSLQAEQTILIKAKLLEVKKSVLRDIGIDWTDSAPGPIFGSLDEYVTNRYFRALPSGLTSIDNIGTLPLKLGTNNYLAFTTVIDSVVKILVNNGDARLLAEPTLTCISGGTADFLVGGELPIPLVDNNGRTSVEYKQFGIILNIAPQANDAALIRTKLRVEVSSVDPSISVLGIPGFATRKTNTEMNMQSGGTMVVAGLYSSEDSKTVVKVPGLGNVPILGELFKSRQFKSGETELIVLVTPQVVTTKSQPVQEGIQKFDDLQHRSTSDLKFKLLD